MLSADTKTKVGCPISTKKLTMTEEFLTTAEELYAALTQQQVIFFIYVQCIAEY